MEISRYFFESAPTCPEFPIVKAANFTATGAGSYTLV
jgi:hypothetical protein